MKAGSSFRSLTLSSGLSRPRKRASSNHSTDRWNTGVQIAPSATTGSPAFAAMTAEGTIATVTHRPVRLTSMLDTPASKLASAAQPKSAPRLDLQQHLADLEAAGLLVRIDRPINKDTELIPLVRWQFIGGMPEDQRRAFLFTNVIDSKGRKYDMPWWWARSPRRRRSMRSAWGGRSRRSARPGWTRSPIRSRRSPPTTRRARRSSSPATP